VLLASLPEPARPDEALMDHAKRTVSTPPRHLSTPALTALLDAPDRQTARGRRDRALLLFLARTGARVSEAVGVPPPQVLLRGKGRKERLVPLAGDLARTLWGRWAIEVTTGRVTARELRGLGEFTRRFPEYRPLVICEPGEQGAAERLGIAAMSWQDFLWQGPAVKG
jgi:integrase